MKNKRFIFFAAMLVSLIILPACSDERTSAKRLKKAFLEKPQGENRPRILHIEGSHYDMGYQQGYLLSDDINEVFSRLSTYVAYEYHAAKTGSMAFPDKTRLVEIHEYMKQRAKTIYADAIRKDAPDLEKELQGMAAGLAAKGSKINYDDLILMTALPDALNNSAFFSKFFEIEQADTTRTSGGIQCSGIAAWGSATEGGRMLHGANLDFSTFGVLNQHVVVLIAKPEKGNAFAGVVFPGFLPLTGMNDKGLSMNEMTSESSDADLIEYPQIPHMMRTRLILQYASGISDAENIVKSLGGGVGWNFLVSDKARKTAEDIESSATHYGFIRPWDDPETPSVDESKSLCVTNQSMACPGFRGYSSDNMTIYQMQIDGIDTSDWGTGEDYMQAWLSLFESSEYGRAESKDRWNRLWSMFSAKFGGISEKDMIAFISDTQTGPHGGAISGATEEFQITSAPVPHIYGEDRQIIDQGLSSIYSCVFDPESGIKGTAWIAAGAKPAQSGTFYMIDLDEHLKKMK